MNSWLRFTGVVLFTLLVSACASVPPSETTASAGSVAVNSSPAVYAPAGWSPSGGTPRISGTDTIRYEAVGPIPVDLRNVPVGEYDPNNKLARRGTGGGRIESPISEAELDRQRAEAMLLPPQFGVERAFLNEISQLNLTAGTSFDSLDYTDCCGGGGNVPPDPELAVGPNHIIAVVNVAFAIYDKSGALLSGPTTFSSFFSGTPGCSNTGVFDPNVLYDESADRFILGIDGNGTDYCVAATTGSDPLGTWNTYGFPTDINGSFFDFPHVGVGLDAIYMGANQFGQVSFAEGRVWAMDKADLYSGATLDVVTRSTGNDSTPQPMHLHGWNQGTWPAAGPHYILTDDNFSGVTYAVWSWEDPFGLDALNKDGAVDLQAATGVTSGQAINWPQLGSSRLLQGNDYRVQDADYRNGDIWMSTTISCNPGGGTVNCARWARIDPTGPTVVDAGVLATGGEYRTFPNVAANHCNDMAMGYTKGSSSTYPSIYVAGRLGSDAPGTLQPETLLKSGEVTYTSFEASGAYRWGDYTEMAADPDGETFWYIGEYSKDTGTTNGRWGTYIGSFSFGGCVGGPGPAGYPSPANGATGVDINADLGWTAGTDAVSHDVYFGTSPNPGAGEFKGNQTGTSYEPGTLTNSTTYYWRIDEVDVDANITTGTVWNFTTEAPPATDMHVESVVTGTQSASKGRKNGTAAVTVVDNNGDPVGAGYEVTGDFSGTFTEPGLVALTNSSGVAEFVTTGSAKKNVVVEFCVSNVDGGVGGLPYNSGDNAPGTTCAPPPATGAISGAVTVLDTTDPIAGASVSADTGESGTTDVNGLYTLFDVPTGTRTVSVSAGGYDPDSKQTTVSDGATSTLDFVLTPSSSGGGSVQIRSITVTTVSQGRGSKSGRAVVVVEDSSDGSAVSGAEVTGSFSGTINEGPYSETTVSNGSATFETVEARKGGVSVTFCVTSITHPTLTDFSGNQCASN